MSPTLSDHITLIRYDDADEWIDAAAAEIGAALRADIALRGGARLLLSGGTTPAPVYQALAELPLDWSKLEVGLVDERWLSPQDSDSNAYLVRQSFLERAEGARFEPLVRVGQPLQDCVHAANLHAQHAPAACMAVLGMGGDGHTASLFPGATDLNKALANPLPYAALDATGCPGANTWPLRITLTPAGLAPIGQRMLLLRGKQKLEVLERALSGSDAHEFPIRVAFDTPGARLRVHWCE
ncbi:6-phosphogluconolactonase [Xanthomonas translucens pv. translucens]|uniref:6-phosphogluconolactonase n=1 Tax=Xanthomonas campestris pv. translucens TaxID=343 RepID=UPI0021B82BEB|nr:6-phosphogluconolactonase [Xanthomonas translucens]MCT8286454.1 6-phosphogluconolactonase [Xanthomonas translucens pv. translucens]MCT8304112.1 6-phosphogluconolactonase [Xanthomonas translucens pv. translucens]